MTKKIKRILVVEDEEDVIELLYAMFDGLVGYEIFYAKDGEDALRIVRTDKPDVIILDIQLPKLNGYELCKLIKSEPAMTHIKIVMLSGMTQICDQLKAKEAGADDYITKPFTSTELVEKIDALLKSD